jgi:hypothetical protein
MIGLNRACFSGWLFEGVRQLMNSVQFPSSSPELASPHNRSNFTRQEDSTLSHLVSVYGKNDWSKIAVCMNGRTARQCRERYKNFHSSPSTLKNTPWTPEEDQLLMRKFQLLGPRWQEIAKFFNGRNNVNVKNRWTALATAHTKKCAQAARFPVRAMFFPFAQPPVLPYARVSAPVVPNVNLPVPRDLPEPSILEQNPQDMLEDGVEYENMFDDVSSVLC